MPVYRAYLEGAAFEIKFFYFKTLINRSRLRLFAFICVYCVYLGQGLFILFMVRGAAAAGPGFENFSSLFFFFCDL